MGGALAPHLSGDRLDQALDAALAITEESVRARALGALAPHLSGDRLDQALDAALAIPDESSRADALGTLAPHLAGDRLARALTAARTLAEPNARLRSRNALVHELERERAIEARSWRDLLATAAILGRPALQSIASAVVPLTREVGGPEALAADNDVARRSAPVVAMRRARRSGTAPSRTSPIETRHELGPRRSPRRILRTRYAP